MHLCKYRYSLWDVVDATHDLLSTVGVIVMASFVIYHFEPKLMCLLGYPLFRPAIMISIIPGKHEKASDLAQFCRSFARGVTGHQYLQYQDPR